MNIPGSAKSLINAHLFTLPVVKSKYLRVLKSKDKNSLYLYHSLFGNLHLVDSQNLQIIELFVEPKNINDALLLLGKSKEAAKIIDEFISLSFLVTDGFDERDMVEKELANRANVISTGKLIDAVQLNISEGCNLKCSYCFADRVDERSSLYNIRSRNERKLMTFETALHSIELITELIKNNGNKGLVIKFFGREPLLNWKVLEQVINHCEAKNDDFTYNYAITTNGTLFTPEIVGKLKEVNATIVVSLDGFEQENQLRLTHCGQESFSFVDKGFGLLKEYGVSFFVASVVSDHNFYSLDTKFIDYLSKYSVKQWEIKLLMQNDDLMKHSSKEYAEKLIELYKYGKQFNIAVTGDWYNPFVMLFHTTKYKEDNCVQRLAPSSCSATEHQISIEPNGNIYGCRALERKLGNINELYALFENSAYKQLSMRTYYNVPYCHGCKLEGFCQGVCLGHSERKFNDMYKPDNNYCEIYRQVFDLLLIDYLD